MPQHFTQRDSYPYHEAGRVSDASNLITAPLIVSQPRPHGHSQGSTVGHRSKQESLLIGALDNGLEYSH